MHSVDETRKGGTYYSEGGGLNSSKPCIYSRVSDESRGSHAQGAGRTSVLNGVAHHLINPLVEKTGTRRYGFVVL